MSINKEPLYGYTLVTSPYDHKIEAEAFHPRATDMIHYLDAVDKLHIVRSSQQSADYKSAEESGHVTLQRFIVENEDSVLDEQGLVAKLLAENPDVPVGIQTSLKIRYEIPDSTVETLREAYLVAQ
jgi:hypothetical protein